MLPAMISALSGLLLFLLWVVTSTTWVAATEDQKAKAQGVIKYVAGVFALATAVNLFYQFKPDPSKKTVIQSASTSI
jgi:ABC-type xylose transport system permease subunit